MQTITVLIIIACAAAYAGWRIYRTFRRPTSSCDGCDGCAMRDELRKKCRDMQKNTPKNLAE